MALPVKHLSARVPWHDAGWNGCVCNKPDDNSFCRVLGRIDGSKDVTYECCNCEAQFDELPSLPPCASEKGAFLSPAGYSSILKHRYKEAYDIPLFKDFMPAPILYKPFSFNAVPYRWMIKNKDDHFSEMADRYGLKYDSQKEEALRAIMDFSAGWIQHPDNQRELLDSFFSCLKPTKSLVFFYAKHTPLSEVNTSVLIGAAYVTHVGDIIDYQYPKGYTGHRSYAWDRIVQHSLSDPKDGCILPYHELIRHEQAHPEDSGECRSCVVEVPDHEQFSYASELVENDTAIDALFRLQSSLKKADEILHTDHAAQLKWLDNAVSRVWDMRGAYPSMGSLLTAAGYANGNAIAWQIDQYIIDTYGNVYAKDAWEIFENTVSGSIAVPGLKITKTNKTQWLYGTDEGRKKLMCLLSRIQMNNDQAEYALNQAGVMENPYRLFEGSRRGAVQIPFLAVDKAMYPAPVIAVKFPLQDTPPFDDELDMRRIRALAVCVLEDEADAGNTLITQASLILKISQMTLSAPAPVNEILLRNFSSDSFFAEWVLRKENGGADHSVFFKLVRLERAMALIRQRLSLDNIQKRTIKDAAGYVSLLIKAIKVSNPQENPDLKDAAILEKADAMAILETYPFSVLVGPAGSGKTTLLKAFRDMENVKQQGVLMLAPTGKARVNMDPQAKTVAQFLVGLDRYDGLSGQYKINPSAKRASCGTLIIDESSMLTEEQLAAVLDAVIFQRLILVGDHRQLPPIGAGRPFFDIVQQLKPASGKTAPAYAELTNISRQKTDSGKKRLDVELSRYFGGAQKADFAAVFDLLAQIQKSHPDQIELIPWNSADELKKRLMDSLAKALSLKPDDLSGDFEEKALGRVSGKFFNYDSSEKVIEGWQVLSPVNGHAYGVKEINKAIQRQFRRQTIDLCLQNRSPLPKPCGRDNFVYGDKVINLGNRSMKISRVIKGNGNGNSNGIAPLGYMANGEIGIAVGQWNSKGKSNVWIAFSSQPGYAYSFYPNELGEGDGGYEFELAYCISVHKSQGSGFDTVFLVLPANNPLLSRELLYTALTRQKKKVIILHQGDFSGYLKYAMDEYSETARRLTDLTHMPGILEYHKKFYDSRHVNITQKGEAVISKSEVIIANILYSYEQRGLLSYSYESKLTLQDGRSIKPDFVIVSANTGRTFYWEHLGLMDQQEYRDKWALKREGYLAEGIVPFDMVVPGDKKVLITTKDLPLGGINSKAVEIMIEKYILQD